MALTYSDPVQLGMSAPEFSLLGTNGIHHGLTDFRRARILVVAFVCNHCPYVQALQSRINALALKYVEQSVQVVAISSNDTRAYPEDSFEKMKEYSSRWGWSFPYLWDETQEVARAYGAVCTPDFFVFENVRPEAYREGDIESATAHYRNAFVLRYRGRLDDGKPPVKVAPGNYQAPSDPGISRHDLAQAIDAILAGKEVSREQPPSMGCSIKWIESPSSRSAAS